MSDRGRRTPHDLTRMWKLKSRANKPNRNRLTDTENTLRAAGGRWVGGWVKKVKGLRSTNGWLQNSHGDVTYSMGNTVNAIVRAMYNARWAREISRGHFVSHIIV